MKGEVRGRWEWKNEERNEREKVNGGEARREERKDEPRERRMKGRKRGERGVWVKREGNIMKKAAG